MTIDDNFIPKLPINKVSFENIVSKLISLIKEKRKRPKVVYYLNAFNANLYLKDKQFRSILNKADLVYADGWGPVLASKMLGFHIPARLTTADFFYDFCQEAEKKNFSLFFLGGKQEVIKRVVKNLKKKFVNLKILGFYHGFFKKIDSDKIINLINKKRPAFLIIGMGTPKQEEWLYQYLNKLEIKVGWCVGSLFEYMAQVKPKCPKVLGDLGLEWIFRLFVEPRRLWKRYLIDLPEFMGRILILKIKKYGIKK